MTSLNWFKDDSNNFDLINEDFDTVVSISRSYEQVMSANGFGLIDDKSKPATWMLYRNGENPINLGSMTVRQAKKFAENLING